MGLAKAIVGVESQLIEFLYPILIALHPLDVDLKSSPQYISCIPISVSDSIYFWNSTHNACVAVFKSECTSPFLSIYLWCLTQ